MIQDSGIDLGDELLVKIIAVTRAHEADFVCKAKSLVRAGKIGEMYLGVLADDCGERALATPDSPQSSPVGIRDVRPV